MLTPPYVFLGVAPAVPAGAVAGAADPVVDLRVDELLELVAVSQDGRARVQMADQAVVEIPRLRGHRLLGVRQRGVVERRALAQPAVGIGAERPCQRRGAGLGATPVDEAVDGQLDDVEGLGADGRVGVGRRAAIDRDQVPDRLGLGRAGGSTATLITAAVAIRAGLKRRFVNTPLPLTVVTPRLAAARSL
ncbi:MAG TPA: hypothetical protein VH231_16100 [Solirubrobacteraceae bacterium]|nr:hypothetical protein [Solirubrobacteraceae bacterium]